MFRTKVRVIKPNWPLPETHPVQAFCTTRSGGVSLAPYDAFNLALHVGDEPKIVQKNRQILQNMARIPSPVQWLDQQHTTSVHYFAHAQLQTQFPIADASWTDRPQVPLAVMTADCVPILLTDTSATVVAAIHAGWRGLLKGVIAQTLQALPVATSELVAWIGPCIRQPAFEVGEEVQVAFTAQWPWSASFFMAHQPGHYLADLAGIVAEVLRRAGVSATADSGLCTFEDSRFYSYRQSPQTGRQASLIWLEPSQGM